MISEHTKTQQKVEEYFESLDLAIGLEDFEKAEIFVSRLSDYTYMFDQDQQDYYEWAVKYVDQVSDDNYYEPTEQDEWYDFDPDC